MEKVENWHFHMTIHSQYFWKVNFISEADLIIPAGIIRYIDLYYLGNLNFGNIVVKGFERDFLKTMHYLYFKTYIRGSLQAEQLIAGVV